MNYKKNYPEDAWQKFLEWIDGHAPNTCYRGHSNSEYLLRPKVGRENYSLKAELNMFEHFKRKVSMYSSAKDDFEWLALAQHHGLPTRLLDWTENPLIGCFFTIINHPELDGRIYSMNYHDDEFLNFNITKSPFHVTKIQLLHPPISTKRIELQKGLFTVHPLPSQPVVIGLTKDLKQNYLSPIKLYRQSDINFEMPTFFGDEISQYNKFATKFYRNNKPYFDIPHTAKKFFEMKLRSLGIDETIFGDIDSIAKKIVYQHQNNLLKQVTQSSKIHEIPYWSVKIAEKIIPYFEKENKDFLEFSRLKVIHNQLTFTITEVDEKQHKLRSVFGALHYYVRPNFEGLKSPKFKNIFYSNFKTVCDFFHDLGLMTLLPRIRVEQPVQIDIQVFDNGIKLSSYSKIRSENTENFINYIEDNFRKLEEDMSYLLLRIEPKDIGKLKTTNKGSKVYSTLLSKYQNLNPIRIKVNVTG